MKYNLELENYWNKIDIDNVFLPVGSGAGAVNKFENVAYIYGGSDYKTNNNKLYKFDFNSEKFELLDEILIKNRFNHKMFYIKNNKLCIIGGVNNTNENKPMEYCNDIILYDILTKKIKYIEIPIDKMKRGQFTAGLDFNENIIYVFGGFNNSDFFKINLNNEKIDDIKPSGDKLNARAGMISEVLPNGNYFIFSGFNDVNKKPICFNDYYIYNPNENKLIRKDCTENIGRTFGKSIINDDIKKLIIFGGSYNGMEVSGSIYFYDYEKDKFNMAYLQPLPKVRVEPIVVFSNKNKKMYIISGLEPTGRNYKKINEIMVLDFNKINEEVWQGHP
jgi:N-acetylneuraminic acid mutarotase